MKAPAPLPTLRPRARVPLAPWTTLGIGGPCRWLVEVRDTAELAAAWEWAEGHQAPFFYLGEGSNVLFADQGYAGLVIRNRIGGIEFEGDQVEVGGGEPLGRLIEEANRRGLGGLESMAGIPGTVAGALVGNAGAYGQEIGDCLLEVAVCSAGGREILSPEQLHLGYRHSLFKERRDLFILRCRLRLRPGCRGLEAHSREIIERRLLKYPRHLLCPGSFFKNIPVATLDEEVLSRLPAEFIIHGKVPAGRLLEAVGACGKRCGAAQVAGYHGNLILNRGGATSEEILRLASDWAERVWERFSIRLEPEIHIVEAGNRSAPAGVEAKG